MWSGGIVMAGVRVWVLPGGEMCRSTGGGGSERVIPPSTYSSLQFLSYSILHHPELFPCIRGCWSTGAVIGWGNTNRTRGICTTQTLLSIAFKCRSWEKSFLILNESIHHNFSCIFCKVLAFQHWIQTHAGRGRVTSPSGNHTQHLTESQRLLLRYVCTRLQKCVFLIQHERVRIMLLQINWEWCNKVGECCKVIGNYAEEWKEQVVLAIRGK